MNHNHINNKKVSFWILLQWMFPLFVISMLWSCQSNSSNSLFERVDEQSSNILFNNVITENDSFNVLDYEYIYNGGGVAVSDFDNDGLQDVFFTGNMVANALYLNKGDFKFQDISEQAGIAATESWCSGVATVDINSDGWMDLYICTNTYRQKNRRKNLLFINQGTNKEGIPQFKNMAEEYGLADTTYAMNSAFFDYDNDGDLDVFIIVNETEGSRYPGKFKKKRNEKRFRKDKLYRNDWNDSLGHAVFTDVSFEAGIDIPGYSLGINIVDINKDGWKDVFVTNDFITSDLFYINNGDGTFTDRANDYFKHTSHSAMGNDIVDINNDGLMDVVALDMLPEDNYRRKTMMGAITYSTYLNFDRYKYTYQYVRNTCQINQGFHPTTGEPIFSDVGMMAGIAATDWSWTPIIADFDNDAHQDIIITNGFPKDVTDRDFIEYQASNFAYAPKKMMMAQIPEVKLKNYAYKNNGNLSFTDVSNEWGIDVKSFSNGAVYADLDNDGDLDYIVNNIDDVAFVFQNKLMESNKDSLHYLRLKLNGISPNISAIGTTVQVFTNGQFFQKEFSPYRGYLSSVEPFLHFGLGKENKVDSVLFKWSNGQMSKLVDIPSDTTLIIDQSKINASPVQKKTNKVTWFTEVDSLKKIKYKQEEKDFIDFNIQRLLPHKFTQYGPGITVGDVNGDGRSDIYVSGSLKYSGELFVQKNDGSFDKQILSTTEADQKPEELGALFFDADNDGDDDLYVVHGSFEFKISDPIYQDQFYRNDGGELILDNSALPKFQLSGSCVRASDFDNDGDLDLFVGGRVHPHEYPKAVNSYLLVNQSTDNTIKFEINNNTFAPSLNNLGMVSDAIWTDIDNDGWMDLLIAGEYMPITIFKNKNGKLSPLENTGLENKKGWWNSIASGDFDQDGDTDYVIGNLGENTLFNINEDHPIKAYGKDFDKNSGYDFVLSYHLKTSHEDSSVEEYPFHGRKLLTSQMVYVKDSFKLHKQFAKAQIEDLFPNDMLDGARILEMNYPLTSLVENKGNGKFEIHALPVVSQVAPVYGVQSMDVDDDGLLDLVMIGNDFGMELTMGKCDAFNGLVLKGIGDLKFTPVSIEDSGFVVSGDGKSLSQFVHNNELHLLAGQNKGPIEHYSKSIDQEVLNFEKMDAYALIQNEKGNIYKVEANYGSGFLSQSSRFFIIPQKHKLIKVVQMGGTERSIE